jgi:hypothetical protein
MMGVMDGVGVSEGVKVSVAVGGIDVSLGVKVGRGVSVSGGNVDSISVGRLMVVGRASFSGTEVCWQAEAVSSKITRRKYCILRTKY